MMTTPRMSRTERLRLERPLDVVLKDLAHVVHVEVRQKLGGVWDEMALPITRGECDRIIKKLQQASQDFDDVAGAGEAGADVATLEPLL